MILDIGGMSGMSGLSGMIEMAWVAWQRWPLRNMRTAYPEVDRNGLEPVAFSRDVDLGIDLSGESGQDLGM